MTTLTAPDYRPGDEERGARGPVQPTPEEWAAAEREYLERLKQQRPLTPCEITGDGS